MDTKKISEVAEEFDISVKTLHYYDRIGLVSPSRSEGGYRLYSQSDVEKIKMIRLYRDIDMPIREISRLMEAPEEAVSILKEHLSNLRDQYEEIERCIDFTKELIEEKESEVV